MLNQTQIDWVEAHKQKMKHDIESKGVENLTDDDWEQITQYIGKCVEQAKSSGQEVRKMLFDFIEKYDVR